VKPARLVVGRTTVAEFSAEVPRTLLTVFTPELFSGCDCSGLAGRRAPGRELLGRLTAAGWTSERALTALDDQIELALEAYAALAESVRQRLRWPAEPTLVSLNADEWIRRFAAADPEEGRWLCTIAGGVQPGLLLRACLQARPWARATLWLEESRPTGSTQRGYPPLELASTRELVLIHEAPQPAHQGRKQS
jgi:hypothetical protein